MSKLFFANIKRLWSDKFFWIGMIFMFVTGIFIPVIRYINMEKMELLENGNLDKSFFAYVFIAAIISSVFCSLFVGAEYSDGTMRNKIVIGHIRTSVYLSNLITCIIGNILMCLAFIVPTLCLGIPLLGGFQENVTAAISMTISSFVLTIALTAIFTLVCMLNGNKSIASIICVLGIFLLIIVGIYLNNRLNQPEVFGGYQMQTADGTSISQESSPNPDYLRGTERQVYEALYDFIPGGQIIQFFSGSVAHLWRMTLFSTIIIIMTTGFGIFFFRKKDLK